MAEIPNLAGVATQDLVETIGAGSFKASYINWARTFNLLHQHAPGWDVEMVPTPEGSHVWRAPGNGGYLMLRFVHADGTATPVKPQSIMDNRNSPILYDKISSRDITDTHRRGACMAAAMIFGLAHELWARMPLESGYSSPEEAPADAPVTEQGTSTMKDFINAALAKGLSTYAADALISKIDGNYAGGIKTLASKTPQWVEEMNASCEPKTESSDPAPNPAPRAESKTVKKTSAKPKPEDY